MKNSSGIYQIRNVKNGNIYIGSAVNIVARWRKHIRDLNSNKHHSRYLQNAWSKYGADCFEFSIIETCFAFVLIFREQHYIDTLKPDYNIAPKAGSSFGIKRSDEYRKKLSLSRIGTKATPETRAKMSASRMGHPVSFEARKKKSEALKGKPSGRLGYKHNPETLYKISESAKGNKNPLGVKRSTETRSRMALARMLWWAKKKEKNNG